MLSIVIIFCILIDIVFRFDITPAYFSYWDELSVFILIIIWLYNLCRNKGKFTFEKAHIKILGCLSGIVIVGLMGNLRWNWALNNKAILIDIVACVKFFITIIIIQNLYSEKDYKKQLKKYCIPVLKVMTIVMFICGIISIFTDIGMSQEEIRYGIRPYYFLFTHPTSYVMRNIMILSLLNITESNSFKYDMIIVINIILAMRSKGIIIVGVYIYLKYIGEYIQKYKMLYLSGVGIISAYVIIKKLIEYSQYSRTTRGTLYEGAILLMKKCFPIGSGLGTYASSVSGKYLSKVYDFIYIDRIFTNGKVGSGLGDAGYAYYIGQFGIIGVFLFGVLLVYMYKMCIKKNGKLNLAILIIFVYIIIALTAENLLLNNGFELGLIFAVETIILKQNDRKELHNIQGTLAGDEL